VVLVLLSAWLLRRTGQRASRIRWHFFFLGAGFLLLEAQIVSRMALLFGTTWLVNAIVVSGLLCLVVLANGVVALRPRIPIAIGYAGIFVTIAIAFVLPLQALFFESAVARALAATALLGAPVFFAGVVFVRSFALAGFQGDALGSNLLGALVGGLLESLSFWTGLRSLLVVAFVLYALSALKAAPSREV
jgi:hypothetical protein